MSQNDQQNDDDRIPPDPIYAKSLSGPILLAGLAVLGASVLAIVDEFHFRRPYYGVQREWKDVTTAFLESRKAVRATQVDQVLKSLDEYRALDAAVQEADQAAAPQRADVQRQVGNLDAQLKSLLEAIKSPRSEIAAISYKAEMATAHAGQTDPRACAEAREYLEHIERIRADAKTYGWAETDEAGRPIAREETRPVGELIDTMPQLQEQKAALQKQLGVIAAATSKATAARQQWLDAHLGDLALILGEADDAARIKIGKRVAELGFAAYLDRELTKLDPGQIDGLISEVDDFSIGDFKQIHIPQTRNWVDRCETCHLNTRMPLTITAADVGGNALYASHPRAAELFEHHDPQKMGCSMCHNGNGMAVTDVDAAHGLNHHWLQRMFPSANYEAGCVQCHVGDAFLEGGERVSQAKENFRQYGCWGCHKMKGYDEEPDQARAVAKRIDDIDAEIRDLQLRAKNATAVGSTVFDAADAASGADSDALNATANATVERTSSVAKAATQQVATLRAERDVLASRLHDLYREQKKVGPNLKDLAAKVRPEWLTQWVDNPRHWRPETKMPVFRWAGAEETKDVAAFLWQSSTAVTGVERDYGLEGVSRVDPTAGGQMFMTVGCLSCHAIGRGERRVGNTFAANLTNLRDKANPRTGLAFYTRWIENPRHRLAPYCTECRRDLTPADFVAAGKKLVFGPEQSTCPNCGHELQWNNPTVMPSFRLTRQQAADIAAFLLERGSDMAFEPAPWLTETERFARGKRLVQHHGCAGCHEIGGLEDEQRIGTELSAWGSKPIERLDFGHYTHDAHAGHDPLEDWVSEKDVAAGNPRKIFEETSGDYGHKWYNHRGFAAHKLAEPDLYDAAKNLDRTARLRMPKFNLGGQEILDLASLLIGTAEPDALPDSIKYHPDDRGQALRDGWWLIRKYNCEGCHQIRPGQVPAIRSLPDLFPEKTPDQKYPPSLVGTGFRTRPDWLAEFLADPSLGGGTAEPQSVRAHLPVRMPTFMFTQGEIRTLVRFFDALSDQPDVYQPPQLAPLTDEEQALAKSVWDNGPCLQCHVVTGMAATTETKAPNLDYAARRLRPEWMRPWISYPAGMQPDTGMTSLFKAECTRCSQRFDNDTIHQFEVATGKLDTCPNPACGADWHVHPPRRVFENANAPQLAQYHGDVVDLLVRYLDRLRAYQKR